MEAAAALADDQGAAAGTGGAANLAIGKEETAREGLGPKLEVRTLE